MDSIALKVDLIQVGEPAQFVWYGPFQVIVD